MATKFHWGHGISIALAIFIIFILSFVYKTLTKPEYDHKLVSDEYYKDEMYYQKEMDRLKNAEDLKEKVRMIIDEAGVKIVFPEIFDSQNIEGTYELQRPNNSKLDIKGDLNLTSNSLLIPAEELEKGKYNLKLLWTYNNIPFQINDKITF